MKVFLLFLIASVSILAQDFIPHLEQLQQNVINKMKANKVKRMEAISYQTDANFYPLSEKYYYSYNYEYNEMGIITLVDYFNVEQDLRIETTYAYDQYGTIESIIVTETSGGTQSSNPVVTNTTFWATVTDGTIERMTKYVSGELTNVYLFNYDGLGLASILDSTVDLSSGVPNTLYTFNLEGNVVSKTSPNGNTFYTYDDKGNVIKEEMEISGSRYETTSDYDGDGNLVGVTVNGTAFTMNWIFQNDSAGLTLNGYFTYYTPGEGTSNYEWTTFIYTNY
jgi:YD repeat-containing protein